MESKKYSENDYFVKILNPLTNKITTLGSKTDIIKIGNNDESDILISSPCWEIQDINIHLKERKLVVMGNTIMSSGTITCPNISIIRIYNIFVGFGTSDELDNEPDYDSRMANTVIRYFESSNCIKIGYKEDQMDSSENNLKGLSLKEQEMELNQVFFESLLMPETQGQLLEKDKDNIIKQENTLTMEYENNIIGLNDAKLNSSNISDEIDPERNISGTNDKTDISKNHMYNSSAMSSTLNNFYKKEIGEFYNIPPLNTAPNMNISSKDKGIRSMEDDKHYDCNQDTHSIMESNVITEKTDVSPANQSTENVKKEFEEAYNAVPSDAMVIESLERKIDEVTEQVRSIVDKGTDIPLIRQPSTDLGIVAIENEILNEAMDEIKSAELDKEKEKILEAHVNSIDTLKNSITDNIKEEMRESIKIMVEDEVNTKMNDVNKNITSSIQNIIKSSELKTKIKKEANKRTSELNSDLNKNDRSEMIDTGIPEGKQMSLGNFEQVKKLKNNSEDALIKREEISYERDKEIKTNNNEIEKTKEIDDQNEEINLYLKEDQTVSDNKNECNHGDLITLEDAKPDEKVQNIILENLNKDGDSSSKTTKGKRGRPLRTKNSEDSKISSKKESSKSEEDKNNQTITSNTRPTRKSSVAAKKNSKK